MSADVGPVLGSLCTGYGGVEQGLALAGVTFRLGWVADDDPAAASLLAHHHPDVPNLGDITAVDWHRVTPVDILTAGFPCQDISSAGRRAGIAAGNRSGLWYHVATAIDALRPHLVLLENVRGLLSARADSDVEPCPWCMGDEPGEPALRALGAVLGDLADLGFDAEWTSLPAAAVGACHLRWRVFILAWPAADAERDRCQGGRDPADAPAWQPDLARRAATHTEGLGHGHPWAPARGRVPPAAECGAAADADRDDVRQQPVPVAGSGGAAQPGGGRAGPGELTPRARDAERGAGWGEQPGRPLSETAALLLTPTARWGDYAAAIARHEAALGRPAPDPTEPGTKGQPRLSARFVEWMQMLPDGHVTAVPGMRRNDALRLLGNGVVPPQAAAAVPVDAIATRLGQGLLAEVRQP